MTSYVDDNQFPKVPFKEGAAPATPASGLQHVYIDIADHKIKRKDSSGSVTTIEGGGGASSALPSTCQGRLTLTSGTPVTTADVTAATSVFFTPYKGSQVGTYSGSAWTVQTFTEKTLSLSGLTANTNYDVFIVDGTLALEALAWSTDTTRATALVLQDGVYVKTGATTRRYLGTIRITGTTGQCEDSLLKRYVWSYDNPLKRPLQVFDATDTWTYAVAAWRQARATTGNKVEYVCGLSEQLVEAQVLSGILAASGQAGGVGVGVDSTTATSAQLFNEAVIPAGGGSAPAHARYRGWPGIGYHYLAWLEYARAGTVTFQGDAGVVDQQSGIIAEVWA